MCEYSLDPFGPERTVLIVVVSSFQGLNMYIPMYICTHVHMYIHHSIRVVKNLGAVA